MTGKRRSEIIQERLQQTFAPDYLKVIDDSDHHIGHAGHQGGERHFTIEISSETLKGLSRIEAHRRIYAEFTDMIPDQIHALRIKIL